MLIDQTSMISPIAVSNHTSHVSRDAGVGLVGIVQELSDVDGKAPRLNTASRWSADHVYIVSCELYACTTRVERYFETKTDRH